MHSVGKDIRQKDILQFLGYGDGKASDDIMEIIVQMKEHVLSIMEPRFIYHVFALSNGQPQGCDLSLKGKDIQRLLKESHACIIMAATLGARVDMEMKRLQVQDMTKAIVFDACANAAVEGVCDELQEELTKTYPYLTDRYSCGYGDLPITLQKQFVQVLDASKKIGLYVNESSVLVPLKSVTAILGIADRVQPAILRGCGHCQLVKQCAYRKRGTFCGN